MSGKIGRWREIEIYEKYVGGGASCFWGRFWGGLAPTGGDSGEEGGWALVDPGVLQFFGLNMLTFTGCTPDLKACDVYVCSNPVLQCDFLHALTLGRASMASCYSFHSGCSCLQSRSPRPAYSA